MVGGHALSELNCLKCVMFSLKLWEKGGPTITDKRAMSPLSYQREGSQKFPISKIIR